jgi:hypothetical protein
VLPTMAGAAPPVKAAPVTPTTTAAPGPVRAAGAT